MTELVKDEGETLIGENAGGSSADIASMISKMQETAEPIPEQSESKVVEQEGEQSQPPEETAEIPEQQIETSEPVEVATPKTQQPVDVMAIYRQAQEDLLKSLQTNVQKPVQETKPQKTKEQMLEEFSEDPEGFISKIVSPYKEHVQKMEEEQFYQMNRMSNKTFARLEPVIRKVFVAKPELGKGLKLPERVELGFLVALGLEKQKQEMETQQKDNEEKSKRFQDKKAAAGIPSTVKREISKPSKDPEKMTAKEIEEQIRKLTG